MWETDKCQRPDRAGDTHQSYLKHYGSAEFKFQMSRKGILVRKQGYDLALLLH